VQITNITGKLPSWFQGTVVRNVQGLYEQGNDEAYHWNDALTGIHLIKIDGETVTHINKRLNTTALQAATATNGFPFIGYGTPPVPGQRPRGGQDPNSPFKKKMASTQERLDRADVSRCELCCTLKSVELQAACSLSPDSQCGDARPCPGTEKVGYEEAKAAAQAFTLGRDFESAVDYESPTARKLLGFNPLKPKYPYAWNPGVDVSRIGDVCIALTDQNLYTSFDCDTADTLEAQWNFDDSQKSIETLSAAHWRYDPATDTHYDFISSFGFAPFTQNTYKLWRLKKDANGKETTEREFFAELKGANMSFVHSFHLTEKYIVFTRPPAHYSFFDLVFKHSTPYNATFLDPTVPVKFHIVDRESGKQIEEIDGNTWTSNLTVAKPTAFRGEGPGWFHSHTVNAYEAANGTIVADYCAYPDMGIFYGDFLLNLVDNPYDYMRTIEPARLVRCLIDVTAKSTSCRVVVDKTFELPTYDMERRQGKEYRYAYASSAVGMDSDFVDQLVKVDLQTSQMTHEWHDWSGGHWFVNEPVFIANPNGTDEDDGVLTCVVWDAESDASSLLVLNAKDFTELARVHLGVKVQAHFHGKFCKSFGDKSCVGL